MSATTDQRKHNMTTDVATIQVTRRYLEGLNDTHNVNALRTALWHHLKDAERRNARWAQESGQIIARLLVMAEGNSGAWDLIGHELARVGYRIELAEA